MSKTKNIDFVSPYLEAIQESAVMVSIMIGGKRRPAKAYKESPWIINFTEGYIEVDEEGKGFRPKRENVKKISRYGIEKMELGVIQKPMGPSMGRSATRRTLLRLEIDLKYGASEVWICDGLSLAPAIMNWLTSNEIPIIDPFNLATLFTEKEDPAAYLKENFKELAQGKEKYAEVYVDYLDVKPASEEKE